MKLLLVDDDPIFRLGFCTALAQVTDWAIASQSFVEIIGDDGSLTGIDTGINLILCDPGWQGDRRWLRYRALQQAYPDSPILLLTSQLDTERLAQAKRDGIQGYCPKGMAIADLIPIFEHVINGNKAWSQRPTSKNQNILASIRRRGINDIYRTLDEIDAYLITEDISALNRSFLQGRRRELKAAAWVVRQILPQTTLTIEPINPPSASLPTAPPINIISLESLGIKTTNQRWQTLLENVCFKLNQTIDNRTDTTLETDILSIPKRRELYYLILQQFTQIFNDSQWVNIDHDTFQERHGRNLRNLWKFTVQEFIGRHNPTLDTQGEWFVTLLSQGAIAISDPLIKHCPYSLELFAYLLRDESLIIDNVAYRTEAKEAIERAQLILENLLLQIANSVMQFILNNFSESETFKYQLYSPNLRSSRAIAQFRNDLSWQYRRTQYWLEPKAIFESQYPLLQLTPNGIHTTQIYAPRYQELDNLRSIAWGVTITLELRDALAPRVRSVVAWLGKIVVYLLTNVVGRALGLIARGISDGVGTSWQSLRGR